MRRIIHFTLFISLVSFAHTALAEKERSPEELVSLCYQMMRERNMTAVTENMHSSALANFKKMLMPFFEKASRSGEDQQIFQAFTRGDSLEQVRRYSPQEFYSRFLQGMMILVPGMDQMLEQSTIKPIGHITEKMPDGDVIHVVYRATGPYVAEGTRISKVLVQSLMKDGSQWKLLLSSEIEGMLQNLLR